MLSAAPYARVALAIPVLELFDYRVPPRLETQVVPGARVRVPFGRTVRTGYCIERSASSRHPEPKEIDGVLDEEPILSSELLRLAEWTASYYLVPIGDVIEAAVPQAVRASPTKLRRWVRLRPGTPAEQMGNGRRAREKLLAALREAGGELPAAELLARAGCGESAVRTLCRQNAVEVFRIPDELSTRVTAPADPRDPSAPAPFSLTSDQERAIAAISAAAREPAFQTFLLVGVTGSGKTEVYLQVIRETLAHGRSALVLLPEIALTPQTVARFQSRLGRVAVLHSLLPAAQRAAEYRRLRNGEARVAIGARSAIFAPCPDLGVIVVDESHDGSYKQESSPRYHGRDLAVVRASQLGIPCVLGTATPSMESIANARAGRYIRLDLPHRVTGQPLAPIEIVDRNGEAPDRAGRIPLLSPRLLDLLHATIARHEQAILFLNRRGYARNVRCPRCGYFHNCTNCDIGLTYHRRADRSQCHYCGAVRPLPAKCPQCDFASLRRSAAGTERIEEILARLLPGTAIGRLDRDTVTSRGRLEEILEKFRSGRTRILVGTQMVAKGHDIPGVTLVGVIDADVALHLPDFRAAERTNQLICQVAGRAGRGDRPGRVIVQTRNPDHYAITAAVRQSPDLVFEHEAPQRKLLGYPPFGYLVRVVCEDSREERSVASARSLADVLTGEDYRLLGPAPAPLTRLRKQYRHHLLLKGPRRGPLLEAAGTVARHRPRWSTTRVIVDVDPKSIL